MKINGNKLNKEEQKAYEGIKTLIVENIALCDENMKLKQRIKKLERKIQEVEMDALILTYILIDKLL